jgi:hypothetical protein
MNNCHLDKEFGIPSAFAVDISLARLDMATLRTQQGLNLDKETLASAKLARDFFTRKLRISQNNEHISESLVPRADAREALQNSLSFISSRSKNNFDLEDMELIKRFVEVLTLLVDTGRCDTKQSEELRFFIRKLEPKQTEPTINSGIDKLFEKLING